MKVIILISICFNSILAQNLNYTNENDLRIDSLMNKQIQLNNSKRGVDGFRVQIHHNKSQSREESQKVRAKFSTDFPELKTYLEFKSPYYKIQVGDFVSKLEAQKTQNEISKIYKGTYIVPAIISFEEVVN